VLLGVLSTVGQFKPPRSIDYTGAGNVEAAASMRIWSNDIRIMTYGSARTKRNTFDFTDWDLKNGYPNKSRLLYDDSYDEGTADMNAMNNMKVKCVTDGQYDAGIVKFYIGPGVTINVKNNIVFPYNWQELIKSYKFVRMLSPGRAHSPEVYLIFAHRRGKDIPSDNEYKEAVKELLVSCYMKAILMGAANLFRSLIFRYGCHTVMTRTAMAEFMGSGLLEHAARHLAFGKYATPETYTWHDLGVTKTEAIRDEGVDLLPDLTEMAKALKITERKLIEGVQGQAFARGKRKSLDAAMPHHSGQKKSRDTVEKVRDTTKADAPKQHAAEGDDMEDI